MATAESLGNLIGSDKVVLWSSRSSTTYLTRSKKAATVVDSVAAILRRTRCAGHHPHARDARSARGTNETPGPSFHGDHRFDVLFVDEAWQLPHHLFDKITYAARVHVGVGDVGQLPPLEIAVNPWRGDPASTRIAPGRLRTRGDDTNTWATELPPSGARPASSWACGALHPNGHRLNCVAAPGDRSIDVDDKTPEPACSVWQ